MAFSPTVAWNTAFLATPAGSDDPRQGDDRIRELKTAVDERLAREMFWGLHGGSSAGQEGNLRAGAGRVYHQSSAPTTKPDGNSLDADDVGRLYCQSNTTPLYVRTSNSTWVEVPARTHRSSDGTSLLAKVLHASGTAASVDVAHGLTAAKIRGIAIAPVSTLTAVDSWLLSGGSLENIQVRFTVSIAYEIYITVFYIP